MSCQFPVTSSECNVVWKWWWSLISVLGLAISLCCVHFHHVLYGPRLSNGMMFRIYGVYRNAIVEYTDNYFSNVIFVWNVSSIQWKNWRFYLLIFLFVHCSSRVCVDLWRWTTVKWGCLLKELSKANFAGY